jgi:DNA-binding transcriptional LysR family regulator
MRISPDFRRFIVGSPAYFERHGVPEDPEALLAHDCIALRLKTNGATYAWPLMKEGREQKVRFQARFIFNGSYQVLSAALSGCGLAFSPEYLAGPHIAAGRLRCVLEDWSPVAGGFYAYYPSRRHMSRVVLLVLDALRHHA